MKVGIDLDNTAVNTDEFYSTVAKFYFGRNPDLSVYSEASKFGVSEEEFKLFKSRCWEMYLYRAKPFDGFIEFIHSLQDEGHTPMFVSVRDRYEYDATMSWLEKYNIVIPFYLCGSFDEKMGMCRQLGLDIMLDDTIKVYEACSDIGIKSYLHTRPYNQGVVVERRYDVYNNSFLRRIT